MTKSSLLPGLLFSLCVFGSAFPALPQAERDSGDDPVAKLQRAGWKIVQDGVLQRQAKPQEIETFVFGAEGFAWKLRDLRSQLTVLRRELQANPTPELRRALASHRKAIASTLEMIERARAAEASGASGEALLPKTDCTLSFAYDAQASYKTDRQGTWADASASFNSTPGCNFTGEVYAYAFAKTTVSGAPTTATVTDGPRTGANVSAQADANRNGGSPCESYAFASVTSNNLNPSSYSKSQSNELCPPPGPSVAVVSDQPSYIPLEEFECTYVTWTVNISGGTPGYTSRIYRNDVFQGYGTSYSEEVCHNYEQHYTRRVYITIRADVTDSAGQSRSASSPMTEVFFNNWRP